MKQHGFVSLTGLGIALAAASSALPAQILPGHSIVGVSVTGVGGEMYDVDHTLGTATQLTIGAPLAAQVPNSVIMLNPVLGYLGTNNAGATANLFSISVTGTTVAETQLNTTATRGQNAAQVAVFGNNLYFCVQNGAAAPGWIQSVPIGGGPVADEVDLSTIGMTELANALCELGGNIYCASFNSSPGNSTTGGPGELVEWDPVQKRGRKVMDLPLGKFDPVGNAWRTGIVNMRQYPLQPNLLALLGVYGDLLLIDPATAMVVRHDWTGTKNAGGNSLASGSNNGFAFDPVAQDWIVSTRSGSVERWVGEQQANDKIPGVGSHATPTSNSSTSIDYVPLTGGSDVSYGGGCMGNLFWEPTDSSFGVPTAGNSNFKFGLFSLEGGDRAVLLVGLQNGSVGPFPLPLDLAFLGATPSCFLRTDILLSVPAPVTGTTPGTGRAIVPFPIPASAMGVTLYRQWAVLQATASNPASLVVSNARRMDIQ